MNAHRSQRMQCVMFTGRRNAPGRKLIDTDPDGLAWAIPRSVRIFSTGLSRPPVCNTAFGMCPPTALNNTHSRTASVCDELAFRRRNSSPAPLYLWYSRLINNCAISPHPLCRKRFATVPTGCPQRCQKPVCTMRRRTLSRVSRTVSGRATPRRDWWLQPVRGQTQGTRPMVITPTSNVSGAPRRRKSVNR